MNKRYPHRVGKLPAPDEILSPNKLIIVGWWAREDSNLQPSGYEPLALTIELRARRLRWSGRFQRAHYAASVPPAQQEYRLFAEQILATGICGYESTRVTPSLVFVENPAHTISLIRGQRKRLERSMLPMRFPERMGWGNEINGQNG